MDTQIIIASDIVKAKYERAKQFVMDVLRVKNPIIELSSIRHSAILTAAAGNSYEIGLLQENVRVAGIDRGVEKNNMFLGYESSLMLGKEKGTNTGGVLAMPYPDGTVFSNRPASQVTEVDALMTVYNGSMSVEDTDGTKLLLPRPTIEYLRVPQKQYTAFATGVPETLPQTDERAYKPFEPFLVISGGKATTLRLQLGGGDKTNIGGASGTQNIVIFHSIGFTARNMADKYQLYLASLQS